MATGYSVFLPKGTELIVREWDDMAKEFGIRGGDIPCPCGFVTSMRQYCGRRFLLPRDKPEWDILVPHEFGYSVSMAMVKIVQHKRESL